MIMADCGKHDQTVLWAYLRDQLPVKDMIKVQYHLFSCVSCQKRIANMRKLSLAMSSVELPKKKSVFYKSRWFYIAWAACFLVFFLAGVSYYMVFVDNVEEYPVDVRQSPGYEVIDSVAKKTDSLIISPDSILENNFE